MLMSVLPGSPETAWGMDKVKDVQEVFFETKVEPLLKAKCFACHSHDSGKAKGGLVLDSRQGWQQGGGLGPAIIPGNPEDSLLIQAVRYDGLEMPPVKQLAKAEISILESWVKSGAFDNRVSKTNELEAGALWALQPIQKSDIPKTTLIGWDLDPIDRFILAGLEQQGLTPSAAADKYTLLRRVTLDLTGLVPTPEEIEAFVNDDSPDAYARVVSRLLDSPAFGEHWARHWFDLSCYADVQGNTLIGDAWRYRDYVIDAFNADKPLDRFIHEQIAGDQLPYSSVEQQRELIVATGYLSIGPWVIQNYIKPQLAADIVDHQIDRIGRTFLGQTLSCARCHNHKFDPVPTRDYYALAGIFHSSLTTEHTGPGVWSSIVERELPQLPLDEAELIRVNAEKQRLSGELQRAKQEVIQWYRKFPSATDSNVLISTTAAVENEAGKTYQLSAEIAPSVWAGASQATRSGDALVLELLREDGSSLRSFVLEPVAWPANDQAPEFRRWEAEYRGDGQGMLSVRITSSHPGNGRFAGALDNLQVTSGDAIVFSEDFDTISSAPLKGKQAHTGLTVLAKAQIPGWDGLGINHSHMVERESGNFALQIFSGSSIGFDRVQPESDQEREEVGQAKVALTELQKLAAEFEKLSGTVQPEYAMALADVPSPANARIYRRGDFNLLGDEVRRGVPQLLGGEADIEVPEERSGRLELARWLTSDSHPLTSRVLVNRIWHHLFGKGIVATVDYFGVHGERPSHPELLDHLAIRLKNHNRWSLKETIRQLVLSRTYQMSSTGDAAAAAKDPDNAWYWRMNRRRLSGEAMRDSMLQASGRLERNGGGSPLGLELQGNIRGAGGNVNPPTWGGKIPDYVRFHRTVYQPLKRERPGGELEILSVFDFPHPNDITGARAETTVATQALFLMNSPFVKGQAADLNNGIHQECPDDESSRLRLLYLLVVGREASGQERDLTTRFLDALAMPDSDGTYDPAMRRKAWEQLCHSLLVSNSFLFKE